jgi:hypothetical protein
VSVVVPTILEIYQKLLGVRFVEHKGETWHPGKTPQEGQVISADKIS